MDSAVLSTPRGVGYSVTLGVVGVYGSVLSTTGIGELCVELELMALFVTLAWTVLTSSRLEVVGRVLLLELLA